MKAINPKLVLYKFQSFPLECPPLLGKQGDRESMSKLTLCIPHFYPSRYDLTYHVLRKPTRLLVTTYI